MAENHDHSVNGLREELNGVRTQLENLARMLDEKKGEITADVASKISGELERYRRLAHEQAHRLYDAGAAGVEEVGDQVRRNPVLSLAIAFGAGCVLSCLVRHLR